VIFEEFEAHLGKNQIPTIIGTQLIQLIMSPLILAIQVQKITLPDMIFLTDPTMRISYTFHLLELYDTRFPYSITSRLRTRHL
jgi:hypothetical protein